MSMWRWSVVSLALVGLVALAGTKSPVLAGGKGTKFEWKAFDPKAKPFYQEMTSKITQDMKVMNMEVSQKTEQTFYTSWTPQEKDKDGNYVVVQKILGIKMNMDIGGNKISYDSTAESQPQNPLTDFFNALKTGELKFTIKPDMSIVSIEGRDEFLKKLGGANPQMEPLLKNILSTEALKQMAEQTWFALPSKEVAKDDTWEKSSSLNLGPIGTYNTKYTFKYEGPKDKLEVISAKVNLTYAAPMGKDGLPFTIKNAKLASDEGTGQWLFNPEQGRFDSSSLKMTLKGDLTIDVGGMETTVNLTQVQESTSKFSDTDPLPAKKTK